MFPEPFPIDFGTPALSSGQFPESFPIDFGTPALPAGQGTADITLRLPRRPPPRLDDLQAVSVHTYNGIQLYQYLPDDLISLAWSRNLRDTSRCELVASASGGFDPTTDIVPWLHWVSVWNVDGTELMWTGPIQKVVIGSSRQTLTISARDISAYTARTRTPLTKAWDAADAAVIAGELWDMMVSIHALNADPIRRNDPDGAPFDYKLKANEVMLEDTIKDLEQLGLRWTVVAGTPILGPAPKQPIAALGAADFLDEISLTVDGTGTFNDVLLRGGDALSRAHVTLPGLDLQTIVNIDNMFGVSNTDRAVYQYARHTATIRYSLALPSGAALHPEAPVLFEQLIPSARFVIGAFDLLFLMELESVDVQFSSGNASVQVTMDSVTDDLPELLKLKNLNLSGGGTQ